MRLRLNGDSDINYSSLCLWGNLHFTTTDVEDQVPLEDRLTLEMHELLLLEPVVNLLSIFKNHSVQPWEPCVFAQLSGENFSVNDQLYPLQLTLTSLLFLFSKALIDEFGAEERQLSYDNVLKFKSRINGMKAMSCILPFEFYLKVQANDQ